MSFISSRKKIALQITYNYCFNPCLKNKYYKNKNKKLLKALEVKDIFSKFNIY